MPEHPIDLRLARAGLILAAALLGACAAAERPAASPASGAGVPSVRFDYGFVPFDRTCSRLTGNEIPQARIDELASKLDLFQAHWDRDGRRLLETAVATVGKPFPDRDVTVVMTLCDIPSMSHPLLLNMRRFLDTGPEDPPLPLEQFSALVFHELLHIYVSRLLETSALDEKYADEPGSVRSHLHLMALLKHVYLALGQDDVLAAIVAKDQREGRDVYKRSWQIVNEIEGHEVFVDELRR